MNKLKRIQLPNWLPQCAPNPTVLDTLGWIEHLTGNSAMAAKLLAIASRKLPDQPEVRHTAIAYAATGELKRRDGTRGAEAPIHRSRSVTMWSDCSGDWPNPGSEAGH